MAIARATITTNVWDTVYNHFQTGTYAISTNNIFSAWNSELATDKGYPLVIIHPPSCSIEKVTANQTITNSEVIVQIEVFTTTAAACKALMDSITNSLYTGRFVFQAVRMMNMNIGGGNFDSWEEGQKKIHVGTMDVTWRYIEA